MFFHNLKMENKLDYLVEFLGTFLLVFFGTGAIIVSDEFGIIHDFGIGVVFGLTVWLLVQFFGKFSDCHINPAVTLSVLIDNKIAPKKAFGYIVFQLFGAFLASSVLFVLFPENVKLGNTLPRANWEEAFVYEFFLSFALMLVILISTSVVFLKKMAPFFIGFTVFLEAWLAGYICGASMNPARSFGPAIVSGNTTYLGLYFVAPILGMFLVVLGFKIYKKALQ